MWLNEQNGRSFRANHVRYSNWSELKDVAISFGFETIKNGDVYLDVEPFQPNHFLPKLNLAIGCWFTPKQRNLMIRLTWTVATVHKMKIQPRKTGFDDIVAIRFCVQMNAMLMSWDDGYWYSPWVTRRTERKKIKIPLRSWGASDLLLPL